jgi:hypothetical protein
VEKIGCGNGPIVTNPVEVQKRTRCGAAQFRNCCPGAKALDASIRASAANSSQLQWLEAGDIAELGSDARLDVMHTHGSISLVLQDGSRDKILVGHR